MPDLPDHPELNPETLRPQAFRRAAVLILANNEAQVIAEAVASVTAALQSGDAIFVIADNCTDETAARARQAGARVLERETGTPSSKGAALTWFVRQAQNQLGQYDFLTILDADNRIPPDFISKAKACFQTSAVLQCLVQPVDYQRSALSSLIALSDLHEQLTMDAIRSRLGWQVRLRGTGMLIPPAWLQDVAGEIDTEVEDFALTLLFATHRVRIIRDNRLWVYDAKPNEAMLASRQRARWYRGQWAAFRRYGKEIGLLLLRGPAGWALLDSLFLKPRWLVDLACLVLGIALMFFCWPLGVLFLLRPTLDLVFLAYTLLTIPERGLFARALLHLPGFIIMWLKGMLLAAHGTNWLRGRD